jgi:uncharacterized protein (DUF849 family)
MADLPSLNETVSAISERDAADARPVLISVAPNGARRSKVDHQEIPLSPAELGRVARECRDAGAGLIHLHVRDSKGSHTLAPEHYRPAIESVQDAVGTTMIVQITTEAVGRYSVAEQMASVRELRPQAASFAIRELIPDAASENKARDFFEWVAEEDIAPQFILYSPDDAARTRDLIERGVLPFTNPPVLFVLGRYGDGACADPAMIPPFVDAWLPDGHWSVCAFGRTEIAAAAAALAFGGHVRVGFENNLQRPDGSALLSNAEQVAQVAAIASILGRRRLNGGEVERGRIGDDRIERS